MCFWFSRLSVHCGSVLFLWVSVFSSFGLGWFLFFCDVDVMVLGASAFFGPWMVLTVYSISRILLYQILENHIGK